MRLRNIFIRPCSHVPSAVEFFINLTPDRKPTHGTALNAFFNGTKIADIDVMCEQGLVLVPGATGRFPVYGLVYA